MKTLLLFAIALVLLPIAFVACKTAPTADQLARVRDITRATVQSAVTVQLSALPAQRPYIEASLKAVNDCIAQGKVTATALGKIVNTLPLDPNVIRYTQTGLLVFDALSVFWLNPATDAALRATASGISDGLTFALSLTPKSKSGTQWNASLPKTAAPPAPTSANTRKI